MDMKEVKNMKGYKGMNKDMTCKDMKFEVGKTYHIAGKIILCQNGLHFCKKLTDVFSFYDRDESRFFEIETEADVISDGIKSVTSEITIVRELKLAEINRIIYGNGNGYGYGYGDGYGDGRGYGYGDHQGDGCGTGYGYGHGSSYGYGDGYGDGGGNSDLFIASNIQKILKFKN